MRILSELFANNRDWAKAMRQQDPNFFQKQAEGQSPGYLWIGCADSRVADNQIVGLPPGELFVHRNIANVVSHSDPNCLAVLQYAIDTLQVKHVIVCGHYKCGGIHASLHGNQNNGVTGNWISHIDTVREKYREELSAIADDQLRWDRLCELNIIEQVGNVCCTSIARAAWARGQELSVHGWIYDLRDGLLHDLHICVTDAEEFIPLPT